MGTMNNKIKEFVKNAIILVELALLMELILVQHVQYIKKLEEMIILLQIMLAHVMKAGLMMEKVLNV